MCLVFVHNFSYYFLISNLNFKTILWGMSRKMIFGEEGEESKLIWIRGGRKRSY
jgi:hypothetical protein